MTLQITEVAVGPCRVRVWSHMPVTDYSLRPDKKVIDTLSDIHSLWVADPEKDIEEVAQLVSETLNRTENVWAFEITTVRKHGIAVMLD